MQKAAPEYFAYLLRVWRTTGSNGAPLWHASLESPDGTTRQGFASLDALFAFLENQTGDWNASQALKPNQNTDE